MVFESDYFWGADGLRHDILKCSVADLGQLSKLFRILYQTVEEESNYTVFPTFASLYQGNLKIRNLCHEILALNGVKLDWIDLDMLVAFCLADGDQPAILAKINHLIEDEKPRPKTEADESFEEICNKLLGTLVASGLSVSDAEHLLSTKSFEDIEQILKGINPEIDKKEKEQKLQEENLKAVNSDLFGKSNSKKSSFNIPGKYKPYGGK